MTKAAANMNPLEELKKEREEIKDFIMDSIDMLSGDRNLHDVMRSFRRVFFEWEHPEQKTNDCTKGVLLDMKALDCLLIDIAEAMQRDYIAVLRQYE